MTSVGIKVQLRLSHLLLNHNAIITKLASINDTHHKIWLPILKCVNKNIGRYCERAVKNKFGPIF